MDGRKRNIDPDDSARPTKRVKSDSISKPEPSRMSQSDSQSRREEKGAHQERVSGRESKISESSTTANGRVISGGRKDGEKAVASPRPPPNGVKVTAPSAGSNRQGTPKKGDGSSTKASLPPLLSPLRLELGADPDPSTKTNKTRPAEGASGHLKPPIKAQKPEAKPAKRLKSPLRLPPLLSPTLPPIVEQELARMKRTPSKGEPSQPSSQGSDHVSGVKNSRSGEDGDDDRPSRAPTKPSLIVTIKYKKKDAKSVQRLLALKPRPRVDKDVSVRERSENVEDVPSPARKRPMPSDASQESIAAKRPKLPAEKTIAGARPAAPSTPLKTTAMSRAASSNSLARTPGDATSTPSDRPNTSTGDRDRERDRDRDRDSDAAIHRGRFDRFVKLGRTLKHDRDAVLRSGPRLANGAVRQDAVRTAYPSGSDRDNRKLVAVLSLEMLMAYILAFGSLDQAREQERKMYDPQNWESLLPHVMELRGHSKGFKPLEVMVLQFQAQIYEQLNKALLTQE